MCIWLYARCTLYMCIICEQWTRSTVLVFSEFIIYERKNFYRFFMPHTCRHWHYSIVPHHRPIVYWKNTCPNAHTNVLVKWRQKLRVFFSLRFSDGRLIHMRSKKGFLNINLLQLSSFQFGLPKRNACQYNSTLIFDCFDVKLWNIRIRLSISIWLETKYMLQKYFHEFTSIHSRLGLLEVRFSVNILLNRFSQCCPQSLMFSVHLCLESVVPFLFVFNLRKESN